MKKKTENAKIVFCVAGNPVPPSYAPSEPAGCAN